MLHYKMKPMVTVLAANNDNQDEFLVSLRMVAAQFSATSFLTRGRSRSRNALRADLMRRPMKQEVQQPTPDEGDEGDDDAHAGNSHAHPIAIEDHGSLSDNDVEAVVMGKVPVFYATDSTTELESQADTITRMKMFQQLTLATPYHAHLTRFCLEGDCFDYLRLILKDITTTGQTRYHSVMALGTVKFGSTSIVIELAGSLRQVQTKANRLKAGAIDDEVMTGALLSLAQGHSKFERLATDFSKKSVALSFNDIVDELLVHETNLAPSGVSKPHHQQANLLSSSPPAPSSQPNMEQLALVLSRALGGKKPGQPSVEACRNFQRGRCHKPAADCKYSHNATAGGGRTNDAGDTKTGERKKITCYNCQKLGFHVASECTAPREERRRPRGDAGEQANFTADHHDVDIASFMSQLTQASVHSSDDAGDHTSNEQANMMTDCCMSDADTMPRGPTSGVAELSDEHKRGIMKSVGAGDYNRMSLIEREVFQAARVLTEREIAEQNLEFARSCHVSAQRTALRAPLRRRPFSIFVTGAHEHLTAIFA